MTRVRFAWAALPLLAIAGCDGDGGSIPIGDLGSRFVSANCDIGVRCGTYPDRDSCMASTFFDFGQYEADVQAGRLNYDGNAAASCIAESAGGVGSCSVTTSLSTPQPKSCLSIFEGVVPIGGACFGGFECQSGNCDTSACSGSACCAGSCAASTAPPAAAIGMPCSPLFAGACVAAAFCQSAASGGANGTCVARLAPGAACDVAVISGQCAAGTVCVPDSATCGKLPSDGAPCSASDTCDVVEDYCEPTTGLCVPRVGPRGACPNGNGCVSYATCDAVTHTCIANGQAGDPCSDTAPCLGSLDCSTATSLCTPPAPETVCP